MGLALGLALVQSLYAGGAIVTSPRGDPFPGVPAELLVAAWDDSGAPVAETPTLRAASGERLALTPTEISGVWTVSVTPDAGPELQLRLTLPGEASQAIAIPTATLPEQTIEGPFVVDGALGGAPIRIPFLGEDLPAPENLQVAVGEGRVVEVRETAAGLEVLWSPGQGRQPRAVPVGVRDARRPWAPPTWAVARLRVRAQIPVRSAEPGTRVTIQVGGRTYGPEIVGPEGELQVDVDVYPGEWVGQSILEDELGNRRVSPLPFVQDPRPAMAILPGGPILPGEAPPPIYVMAIDETGRPWAGAAPSCLTGVTESVAVTPVGGGVWMATLPPLEGIFLDVRMDCSLRGEAAVASARIPVGTGRPHRASLRVYPRELSADFPYAQVQAWLEDLRGERLPPDGLALHAVHGELTVADDGELTLRAEYQGDPATPLDLIEARWFSEPGEGYPWSLQIGAISQDAGLQVQVRALDRLGRPLEGAPVSLDLGDQAAAGETGERGWWTASLLALDGPTVIEARSGAVVRRILALPWAPPPSFDDRGPDLTDLAEVTLSAGRVREVFIEAEPAVLHTDTGLTAKIRVRLLDQSRLAVTDEEVEITASQGDVGDVRLLADGTWEADYTPPPGVLSGRVELVAAGAGESFAASTTLELSPRPMERSVSLSAGYIGNFREISGPAGSLDIESRRPWLDGAILGRASLIAWRDRAEVLDADLNTPVEFRMDTFLLAPSVLYRQERTVWAGWAGVGLGLAPYQLEVRYGDDDPLRGWGVHPPGVLGFLGAGRRFLGGELDLEARLIALGAQDAASGYDGQIGGVAFLGGYRVVF